MTFIASLQKNIKAHHVIAFFGAIILIIAFMQYSGRKTRVADAFSSSSEVVGANAYPSREPANVAQPANPGNQNEEYAKVSGLTTSSYGLAPACNAANTTNPADLLPRDDNGPWAKLNPLGASDFKAVNLLKAGYHIGIDTIGSSLRNANLQERSEPPNPTKLVSPWMNSTIEPDTMRAPLEIGCGAQ